MCRGAHSCRAGGRKEGGEEGTTATREPRRRAHGRRRRRQRVSRWQPSGDAERKAARKARACVCACVTTGSVRRSAGAIGPCNPPARAPCDTGTATRTVSVSSSSTDDRRKTRIPHDLGARAGAHVTAVSNDCFHWPSVPGARLYALRQRRPV